MLVRDHTQDKGSYKERPTEANDSLCPCRPCYNAHDCGYYGYDRQGKSAWIVNMECATRWNNGCTRDENGELPKPEHVYKTPGSRKCLRCRTMRTP